MTSKRRAYCPTAALVLEVVSPGDESWEKLGFYAAHQVDEVLFVDPDGGQVHWLARQGAGDYGPVGPSGLIALSPGELAALLNWPE